MNNNLADFYLVKLSEIAAETVVVNISQIMEVIGLEKAEELNQFVVTMKKEIKKCHPSTQTILH